jgi:hypothetical protein
MRSILVILFFFLAIPTSSFAASAISFSDVRAQTTATIASGQTTSAEVDLGGTEIVGLQLPASFTGSSITFQVATASGGTYQDMKDGAGNSVSKTVSQGQYIAIDPALFRGIRFVKLVSGSSEGAARAITVFSIPVR